MNPLFTVSFKCLCSRCRNLCRRRHRRRRLRRLGWRHTIRSTSSRRLLCLWNRGNRSTDTPAVAILVSITVTVAAARGGAFGDFSGGDYRRCDHHSTSILDLSSLFWSEHVWIFAFFFSLLHGFFRNYCCRFFNCCSCPSYSWATIYYGYYFIWYFKSTCYF